jgi:hypothetical protein
MASDCRRKILWALPERSALAAVDQGGPIMLQVVGLALADGS